MVLFIQIFDVIVILIGVECFLWTCETQDLKNQVLDREFGDFIDIFHGNLVLHGNLVQCENHHIPNLAATSIYK